MLITFHKQKGIVKDIDLVCVFKKRRSVFLCGHHRYSIIVRYASILLSVPTRAWAIALGKGQKNIAPPDTEAEGEAVRLLK